MKIDLWEYIYEKSEEAIYEIPRVENIHFANISNGK